jgi:hypothetical protein
MNNLFLKGDAVLIASWANVTFAMGIKRARKIIFNGEKDCFMLWVF